MKTFLKTSAIILFIFAFFVCFILSVECQPVGITRLTSTNNSVTFKPTNGIGSQIDLHVNSTSTNTIIYTNNAQTNSVSFTNTVIVTNTVPLIAHVNFVLNGGTTNTHYTNSSTWPETVSASGFLYVNNSQAGQFGIINLMVSNSGYPGFSNVSSLYSYSSTGIELGLTNTLFGLVSNGGVFFFTNLSVSFSASLTNGQVLQFSDVIATYAVTNTVTFTNGAGSNQFVLTGSGITNMQSGVTLAGTFSGSGPGLTVPVTLAYGEDIPATNFNVIYTNLFGFGDSILYGWGSQYPVSANSVNTAGCLTQVASTLGITQSNQASPGANTFNIGNAIMAGQFRTTFLPKELMIYEGGINDIAQWSPGGSAPAAPISQIALADMAYLCWVFADQCYGYQYESATTNGSSSGSWKHLQTQTNWYPICCSASTLSTNGGDTLTVLGKGTGVLLCIDKWWTNQYGGGGMMSIFIDGTLYTNFSCNLNNMPAAGAAVNGNTGTAVPNIPVGVAISNLANTTHTIVLSNNAPANTFSQIAFDFAIWPGQISATNTVCVVDTYATPNAGGGFTNCTTANISALNAYLKSDVQSLQNIGLPVVFADIQSAVFGNRISTADSIHPSLLGHVAIAQAILGAVKYDPFWAADWVSAGIIVNPGNLPFPSPFISFACLTNVAALHITPVISNTNFVANTIITNNTGFPEDARFGVTYTTAAVTGDAAMRYIVTGAGGVTNALGVSTTVAVSLAMTYTNYGAVMIPNNGTFLLTNISSGSGNSAAVVPGSCQFIQY